MIKKRYSVPALILGLALIGGGTAFAMGPGGFDEDAFTSFSSSEQAAIQQAHAIRAEAETRARAVLDAAGITQDELHEAMKSYHKTQHAKLEAALDSNDYDAFVALIAGSPMANKLTKDTFSKLVEIRQLEKDGDHKGAMELRKELGGVGFMGMGGPGGHGPRPMGGADSK